MYIHNVYVYDVYIYIYMYKYIYIYMYKYRILCLCNTVYHNMYPVYYSPIKNVHIPVAHCLTRVAQFPSECRARRSRMGTCGDSARSGGVKVVKCIGIGPLTWECSWRLAGWWFQSL